METLFRAVTPAFKSIRFGERYRNESFVTQSTPANSLGLLQLFWICLFEKKTLLAILSVITQK